MLWCLLGPHGMCVLFQAPTGTDGNCRYGIAKRAGISLSVLGESWFESFVRSTRSIGMLGVLVFNALRWKANYYSRNEIPKILCRLNSSRD